MSKKVKRAFKGSPYLIIITGFALLILLGALLLWLPFSANDGQSIDFTSALFTAASAVCVTGLSVVPDLSVAFSPFGKVIIALLIQIGGLGFVTTAMFIFTMLGMKIGLNDRLLIKESINHNSARGLVRFIKRIMLYTLIFEGVGFILNLIVFVGEYNFWTAVGISAFHAISSFNNAGMDILGDVSLINYSSNVLFMLNTAILIVLGGVGFIVINDIFVKKSFKKLSVHSKIVLIMTGSIILFSTLVIKLLDFGNISWFQSFCHAVYSRTAGFMTVSYSVLNSASLIITMMLMFVGGSPGSASGGIKTTTLFVLGASVKSFATGKRPVVFYRKLSNETIIRAYILTLLSLIFILLFTFVLSITEADALTNGMLSMPRLLFEVVSAYSTTGFSLGVTPLLGKASRVVVSILMLFGRLGPLTIISAVNKNWNRKEDTSMGYPDANIVIG